MAFDWKKEMKTFEIKCSPKECYIGCYFYKPETFFDAGNESYELYTCDLDAFDVLKQGIPGPDCPGPGTYELRKING